MTIKKLCDMICDRCVKIIGIPKNDARNHSYSSDYDYGRGSMCEACVSDDDFLKLVDDLFESGDITEEERELLIKSKG